MSVQKPIKVLHITAHLGGGVGKALSGLAEQKLSGSGINHTIACLELPEKHHFIDQISSGGCLVSVCPNHGQLSDLIDETDIVQLEWWNHPATISMLCNGTFPAMRLLLWCHISGLYNPIIPKRLIESAHKCIFTSPCSYEAPEVSCLRPIQGDRMAVVHSAGGFDGLTLPKRSLDDSLVAGYLGSLNFAKLHPRYVDFLAAVNIPNFKVRMIGDIHNKEVLETQCDQAGKIGILDFQGYCSQISSELESINVLAYILNPEHYGTTENALLESMAMGIVPIVLDNPAERHLIEDNKTGLIVRNPGEFAAAINWLAEHPKDRQKIGRQAAKMVRMRFTARKMANSLATHYRTLMQLSKQAFTFTDVFGNSPADWFLSCQRNPSLFIGARNLHLNYDYFSIHGLLEQTKGTVFHFSKYFPENMELNQWASTLYSDSKNTTIVG